MIEIINYERVSKDKTIGYVDIILPPMMMPRQIIRRIAHVQSGDRKWFNLPSFYKENSDSTKKYLRYWQFELDAHNGQLLESLGEKVKEYCKENNIPEIEALNFLSGQNQQIKDLPF